MQVKFQYRTNELVTGLFYSMPRSYLGKSVALLSLVLGAYISFQPDVCLRTKVLPMYPDHTRKCPNQPIHWMQMPLLSTRASDFRR